MYPDSFYKNLYWGNRYKSEYQGLKNIGYSDNEALNKVKYKYNLNPDQYYIHGGELPEVVVKPDKNARRDVLLTTYYPVTSRYWATGHSRLDTPGGNSVNVTSNDPGYNFVLNNCSDATREALEYATGKKINPWFFTTPGDVRSFAEDVLKGKSFDNGYGTVETYINLPQYLINKIARYAQLRRNKILAKRGLYKNDNL